MLMPTYVPASTGGGGTLTVEVSPLVLTGFKSGYGVCRTSGAATATVVNAVGSVSYLWEFVSGSGEIYPEQYTNRTTRFSVLVDVSPNIYQGYWRCRATDSVGNVGYSSDVFISLESTYDRSQIPL